MSQNRARHAGRGGERHNQHVTVARAGGVERVVNALATSWPRRAEAKPAFADVVETLLGDVHRYLVLFTADAALAEDLAAATFEKAFRSWRRFDPRRGSEKTWLFGIARSVALDHFRSEERRRRREERYAREITAEAEPFLGGFSSELEAALRTLSAGEREVLALRILLDLDAETTARLLGIGRTACSMRLARALAKLEERMVAHADA
jgi:RNA polymerase sigma-70 factor (ECF subfamily)